MGEYLYEEITRHIIGAAFDVHNALGKGLQEKVYENALAVGLRCAGLKAEQQKPLPLFFNNVRVGTQVFDLIVEERILVEVKAVKTIATAHISQVLGYLKNTKFQLGLIINFGDKVSVKRLILTTEHR